MIFRFKIIANAKKNEFIDKIIIDGFEYYRVKIKAFPFENKANKEFINFLAEFLKISAKNISIINGLKSNKKIVSIYGVENIF